MKAIILAAGRGSRLWPLTDNCPKCLLRLGDRTDAPTILEHQVANLESVGIREAVFVCGYGVDMVKRTISEVSSAVDARVLYNPFYAVSDNLISLWAARSEMDGDFLLLNGDNVFDAGILQLLLGCHDPICLTVDSRPVYNADHMKLQIAGERVLNIGKHLPEAATDAASIGIMLFSGAGVELMRTVLEKAVSDSRALSRHFPDAIQRLIDDGHGVTYRKTKLNWTDVDTLADLQVAKAQYGKIDAAPPSRRIAAVPQTASMSAKETT